MSEAKIELFKPLESWVSVDYVRYFYSKCDMFYGAGKYTKNFDKDCMIMKRVLDFLFKQGKTPKDVLLYIDWIYERSQDKQKTFLVFQIELVKMLISDYFHLVYFKPAPKKKRKKITLSDDTKKWIAEEKKRQAAIKKTGKLHVGF